MIRDYVIAWASLTLVVILAFILMPTYERFKDATGKDVDVDPNAPAMPDWLKAQSTGGAPQTQLPSLKPDIQSVISTPLPPLPPVNAIPPVTVNVDQKTSSLPPPSTTSSTTPSGVKVLPSQSVPASPIMSQIGSNIQNDKQIISNTLPGPNFSSDGPQGIDTGYGDKYVLKSSLVPCSSGSCSKVPGGNDGAPGGSDGMNPSIGGIPNDGIKKPFSEAFSGENEPVGFLNSFSAFMK